MQNLIVMQLRPNQSQDQMQLLANLERSSRAEVALRRKALGFLNGQQQANVQAPGQPQEAALPSNQPTPSLPATQPQPTPALVPHDSQKPLIGPLGLTG